MNDIAGYLESMGAKPSSGSEYVLKCPWCDRGNHLYCNTEEGEGWDGKPKPAGRWICFGCGEKSMDFAVLLAEMDGVPLREARATMNKWRLGGIHFKRPVEQAPPKDPDAPWLPREFEPVSQVWPKYLSHRNISKETATGFNLGIVRRHDRCPECKPWGCKKSLAHRIILPIDCPAGRSYQARAIMSQMEPRYLSGDGSGQLLFGWHTIAESDTAVIVEGPFDALKVAQAGLPVVALMGKELRDSQYDMLRKRRRRYIVALDPIAKDKTAIDSACQIAELLGGSVVVDLVTDPGDADETQILRAAGQAVPPRDARTAALDGRLAKLMSRTR